jgi:hypothetical protein
MNCMKKPLETYLLSLNENSKGGKKFKRRNKEKIS